MNISPVIPLIGLILIIANIFLGIIYPAASPTMMGLQLFIAGMVTLLISVIDLVNPIGITPFERAVLFIAGSIDCSAGYYMVLLETRRQAV